MEAHGRTFYSFAKRWATLKPACPLPWHLVQITKYEPQLPGVVANQLPVKFERYWGELKRPLSIHKIRDSTYDPSLMEVVIGNPGIDVKKVSRNAIDD